MSAFDVVKGMYEKLEKCGINPNLLSVNVCINCEEELSRELHGYTTLIVKHGGMLLTPVLDKKECLICSQR